MGLDIGFSSGRDPKPGNPNPANFEIIRTLEIGKYTIALIRYHGCSNFDGNKVLVCGNTESEIRAAKNIDPHFEDKSQIRVVARFIPTDAGWSAAVVLCAVLDMIKAGV